MPLTDYAHWNEEAAIMWWNEEGKHADEPRFEDDSEFPGFDNPGADDAFSDELSQMDDVDLVELYQDAEYRKRWPHTKRLIEWELKERGITVR